MVFVGSGKSNVTSRERNYNDDDQATTTTRASTSTTSTSTISSTTNKQKQKLFSSTRSIISYSILSSIIFVLYGVLQNQKSIYKYQIDTTSSSIYRYNTIAVEYDDESLNNNNRYLSLAEHRVQELFPRSMNPTKYQTNNNDNKILSKIWPSCQTELYTAGTNGSTRTNNNKNTIDDSIKQYLVVVDELSFDVQFREEQQGNNSTSNNPNTISYDIVNVAQERFVSSFQRFVPNMTISSNQDKCITNNNTKIKQHLLRNRQQQGQENDNDNDDNDSNIDQITKIQFIINSIDSTIYYGVDESYNISIPMYDSTSTTSSQSIIIEDEDEEEERASASTSTSSIRKETVQSRHHRRLLRHTTSHSIYVYSETIYGALRALQTIKQLLEYSGCVVVDNNNNEETIQQQQFIHYFTISHIPIEILDYPAYTFRGLMIDTCRHYFPLSMLVQNLDAMELNKLNVLHWHMTDTQSWPYQSDVFPELSQYGAYCPYCIYTSDDVKHIMKEAHYRGIQVIMEYDLPGHSRSIGNSHPEFLTNCSMELKEPLDVTKDNVMSFIDKLYIEISSLYDYTTTTTTNSASKLQRSTIESDRLNSQKRTSTQQHWIHVGGDEVPTDCWQQSESVQKYMNNHNISDAKELLYNFELQLLHMVNKKLNHRPIVWQELYNSNKPLPMNTIIDVWQSWSSQPLGDATSQEYDVLSSYCYYMDYLHIDWKGIYDCNFLSHIDTKEQLQHVIGGHACMWAEKIDTGNFFSTIYPRTSAMAERLWTKRSMSSSDSNVVERLRRFRCLMVRHYYITASPIEPDDCYYVK